MIQVGSHETSSELPVPRSRAQKTHGLTCTDETAMWIIWVENGEELRLFMVIFMNKI
jgi:hypothetical protein